MPSLVVIEGQSQGKHFPLAQALISVGRDDTCTFQILDTQVSRKHLQVRLDQKSGRHFAGDYRSANGVFINGHLMNLETPLNDGDSIRIGQTTLIYLADDTLDPKSALEVARKKDEWKRSTIMQRE
jgi:pSer/pThr/pTyr-binding forkhead associated (FHA) protein